MSEFKNKENFVNEFFERTIYNLNLYNEKHEHGDEKEVFKYKITQLINSLLGLVIFVKEGGTAFDAINLLDIKQEDKIKWNYCDRDGGKFEEKNFKNFLRHIRNAIAHKNLVINANKEKKINSITFRDKDRKNIFEVTLSIKEIRNMVDRLSHIIGTVNAK
jgi:hypothetical protein